ncbi:MAG: HutD family protein, partial [Candidatus Baltobacteraceae bacterium]
EDESALRAWCVSVATIERDGPFSDFTGYDRSIIALDHPIALSVDGKRVDVAPLAPLKFAGEAAVGCKLDHRPAHDLNVMTRRDRCAHSVAIQAGLITISIICDERALRRANVSCTIATLTGTPLTVVVRFAIPVEPLA